MISIVIRNAIIIFVGIMAGNGAEALHPGSGIFIAAAVPVAIYRWFIDDKD